MGDGRYYTFNQFFTTVILTFLVIFLTISLALSYYRNKDKKSDRYLIVILLILDIIAILKFVEELYMHMDTARMLCFVEIALLYATVFIFAHYLLNHFPTRRYQANPYVRGVVSMLLLGILVAGGLWGVVTGGGCLFTEYTFRQVDYAPYYPLVGVIFLAIAFFATLRVYIMARRRGESIKIRLVMSMIVVLYIVPLLIYTIMSSTWSAHLETIEIMTVFLFGVTMDMILNSNVAYGITPFTFERIRSAMDDYVFVTDMNNKIVFRNDHALNSDLFAKVESLPVDAPESAFVIEDKETRTEQDAVYIRLAMNRSEVYFSYRYRVLEDEGQKIGYIITYVDITELMVLLNKLEEQEQKTKEANRQLMEYKEVVYYLEKEKEINILLEEIIQIQDKSMIQIIGGIDDCIQGIEESHFAEKLNAVIARTEENLNDVRKAVSAYREYYGGNR